MKLGDRVRAKGTRIIDRHFVATYKGDVGTVVSLHTAKLPNWEQEMLTVKWDDGRVFSCIHAAAHEYLEKE